MWGCRVSAPVDDLDAADFDGGGKYVDDAPHRKRLTIAENNTVTFGVPAPELAPVPEQAPMVVFRSLTSAPALGPFASTTLPLTSGPAKTVAHDLAALIGPPSRKRPVLRPSSCSGARQLTLHRRGSGQLALRQGDEAQPPPLLRTQDLRHPGIRSPQAKPCSGASPRS
jgi:hypothetical protein